MREPGLHRERQHRQGEKRGRPHPVRGAFRQDGDADCASRDHEVSTAKISSDRFAPGHLERPDQRGRVERQRGDGEERPCDGAELQERAASLLDREAKDGELRLQRPPQQQLKRETAEGERLGDQDQAPQDHRQIAEDVEEQVHGRGFSGR
ncbi:hypothetical protein ACVIJX_008038 [Bradyrhizobium diazoefficiens]